MFFKMVGFVGGNQLKTTGMKMEEVKTATEKMDTSTTVSDAMGKGTGYIYLQYSVYDFSSFRPRPGGSMVIVLDS